MGGKLKHRVFVPLFYVLHEMNINSSLEIGKLKTGSQNDWYKLNDHTMTITIHLSAECKKRGACVCVYTIGVVFDCFYLIQTTLFFY